MGIQERKEREKELRRLQILVAAKKVFSDKGFGHTTMEDIAHGAELSAGTLYLYFKNKNELYASLTLRILQYLIIRLEQLHRDHQGDEVGKISNLKIALLEVYEFDPLLLRCLFQLQSSDILKQLSPEMVGEISELGRQALDSMAGIFKPAIKKGMCLDLHPHAIADIIWSLFSGVVMLEFSKQVGDGQHNDLRRALELAFEIFENGIMANPHCARDPDMVDSRTTEPELALRAG